MSRVVEAEVKRKEIEKAYEAKKRRREQGMYEGEAPLGLQYDADGEYLICDPEEWPIVEDVFERLEAGETYAEIVDAVDGINSTGTITKLKNRRERYEQVGDL